MQHLGICPHMKFSSIEQQPSKTVFKSRLKKKKKTPQKPQDDVNFNTVL